MSSTLDELIKWLSDGQIKGPPKDKPGLDPSNITGADSRAVWDAAGGGTLIDAYEKETDPKKKEELKKMIEDLMEDQKLDEAVEPTMTTGAS